MDNNEEFTANERSRTHTQAENAEEGTATPQLNAEHPTLPDHDHLLHDVISKLDYIMKDNADLRKSVLELQSRSPSSPTSAMDEKDSPLVQPTVVSSEPPNYPNPSISTQGAPLPAATPASGSNQHIAHQSSPWTTVSSDSLASNISTTTEQVLKHIPQFKFTKNGDSKERLIEYLRFRAWFKNVLNDRLKALAFPPVPVVGAWNPQHLTESQISAMDVVLNKALQTGRLKSQGSTLVHFNDIVSSYEIYEPVRFGVLVTDALRSMAHPKGTLSANSWKEHADDLCETFLPVLQATHGEQVGTGYVYQTIMETIPNHIITAVGNEQLPIAALRKKVVDTFRLVEQSRTIRHENALAVSQPKQPTQPTTHPNQWYECYRCGLKKQGELVHRVIDCDGQPMPNWFDKLPSHFKKNRARWMKAHGIDPDQQQQPSGSNDSKKTSQSSCSAKELGIQHTSFKCLLRSDKPDIIFDSGASISITGEQLEHMVPIANERIRIQTAANGTILEPTHVGTLRLSVLALDGSPVTIRVPEVHFCPGVASTLLSAKHLAQCGLHLRASPRKPWTLVADDGSPITKISHQNGVSALVRFDPSQSEWQTAKSRRTQQRARASKRGTSNTATATAAINDGHTWHLRLGHQHICPDSAKAIEGMPDSLATSRDRCPSCVSTKTRNKWFHGSRDLPSQPRAAITLDLSGPKPTTIAGATRYLLAVDDHSQYMVGVPIQDQSQETLSWAIKHAFLLFQLTGPMAPVVLVRCDNQFNTQAFRHLFTELNSVPVFAAPHQHDSIGRAERAFYTIQTSIEAQLASANMHARFWGYALENAVRSYNSLCHRSSKSPQEIMTGQRPSADLLHPLGAAVLFSDSFPNRPRQKSILEPRTGVGVFLSISTTHSFHSANVLDLKTGRVVIRRSFTTFNNVFPGDTANPDELRRLLIRRWTDANNSNITTWDVSDHQDTQQDEALEPEDDDDFTPIVTSNQQPFTLSPNAAVFIPQRDSTFADNLKQEQRAIPSQAVPGPRRKSQRESLLPEPPLHNDPPFDGGDVDNQTVESHYDHAIDGGDGQASVPDTSAIPDAEQDVLPASEDIPTDGGDISPDGGDTPATTDGGVDDTPFEATISGQTYTYKRPDVRPAEVTTDFMLDQDFERKYTRSGQSYTASAQPIRPMLYDGDHLQEQLRLEETKQLSHGRVSFTDFLEQMLQSDPPDNRKQVQVLPKVFLRQEEAGPEPIRVSDLWKLSDFQQRKWNESMERELHAQLYKFGAYEEVTQALHDDLARMRVGVVPCNWLFKLKPDGQGNVELKSRLVILGNREKDTEDIEKFAPTPTFPSVFLSTIAGLANNNDQTEFCVMDIKNAFLTTSTERERPIYTYLPDAQDLKKINKRKLFRLVKFVYGLVDAPRAFTKFLANQLKDLGFSQSENHPCVFTNSSTGMIIVAYIDDLAIIGKRHDIHRFRKDLAARDIEMVVQADAGKYLGLNWTYVHSERKVVFNATEFEQNLVKQFEHFVGRTKCTTPQLVGRCLPFIRKEEVDQLHPLYATLVGKLSWLANSVRPAIKNAVRELARHVASSTQEHFDAAIRVVSYIKRTMGQELVIQAPESPDQVVLQAYSDASWADNQQTRLSCSGAVFLIGNTTFDAASRTQKTVALSSAEAETAALSMTARSVTFYRRLLADLHCPQQDATIIFTDSMAAKGLVAREIPSARSKHIDIQSLYIRECIRNGSALLQYVPSASNLSDLMTKALGRSKFSMFEKSIQLALPLEQPPSFKQAAKALFGGVLDKSQP